MSSVVQRYCGIELAGVKSRRTSMVILDYYSAKKKLFLLDIFDHIHGDSEKSSDEVLLEAIREFDGADFHIGISAPLSLPPCIRCTRSHCPLPAQCVDPEVTWMRTLNSSCIPYTQRPVDLFMRQCAQHPTQIHDAMGANSAPLAARALFLQKHLKNRAIVEVNPRLSLSRIGTVLGIRTSEVTTSRHFERGHASRSRLLDQIVKGVGVFIYQRDVDKIAKNIGNFDAFMIALTTFLEHQQSCESRPENFPEAATWVSIPKTKISFSSIVAC